MKKKKKKKKYHNNRDEGPICVCVCVCVCVLVVYFNVPLNFGIRQHGKKNFAISINNFNYKWERTQESRMNQIWARMEAKANLLTENERYRFDYYC